jgi:outer membrane protein W
MKKVFLFALLAASTQVSHAQSIAAGTLSLGGSIGYSKSTDKLTNSSASGTAETTTSQFSFTPTVGYFVADNLEVGLSLGYTAYRRPYGSNSSSTVVRAELDPTTTLRLGAFGRYYKMFTEQFGVTGALGAGYQSTKHSEYSGVNIQDYKASGFYADITPAIVFFPIPKLGISASIGSLGYSQFNNDYPTGPNTAAPSGFESKSSTFGANFGLSQLQFGGTYYFGR